MLFESITCMCVFISEDNRYILHLPIPYFFLDNCSNFAWGKIMIFTKNLL